MKNEAMIRLAAFGGVLVAMAIWETLAPRRVRVARRWRRSVHNLMLVGVDTLCVRLFPALSAVAAANWAGSQEIGLWRWWRVPAYIEVPATLLVLDLLIYGQHVATHRWSALWRIHRVHHADLDLDATSGVRFHPLEILFSAGVKAAAVLLLGAAASTVMVFEIVLNATAIFSHGNVRLPDRLDRLLRRLLVTPDMHRVHHSYRFDEMNSNFGFNLPWWDRLFGTYLAQPREAHERLRLGLPGLRTEDETAPLAAMLLLPFRAPPTTPGENERSS